MLGAAFMSTEMEHYPLGVEDHIHSSAGNLPLGSSLLHPTGMARPVAIWVWV